MQTPENTALMELKPELTLQPPRPRRRARALERLRALARALGIYLHVGSLAIRLDAPAWPTALICRPRRQIAARYDKLHLFDVDLAHGESHRECEHCQPGAKAVVVDLPFGRLGLSICYDLRFPQLYRALAISGAELIAIPAASPSRPAKPIGMC